MGWTQQSDHEWIITTGTSRSHKTVQVIGDEVMVWSGSNRIALGSMEANDLIAVLFKAVKATGRCPDVSPSMGYTCERFFHTTGQHAVVITDEDGDHEGVIAWPGAYPTLETVTAVIDDIKRNSIDAPFVSVNEMASPS